VASSPQLRAEVDAALRQLEIDLDLDLEHERSVVSTDRTTEDTSSSQLHTVCSSQRHTLRLVQKY
jgi:hypothetical protein